MSELITMKLRADRRRQHLLTGVSAVTIIALMNISVPAQAGDDSKRPLLWIELGGQLDQLSGNPEKFKPPFVPSIDTGVFTSPSKVQQWPLFSHGMEGSISFQPDGGDWQFAASLRYGRSSGGKSVHQLSAPVSATDIVSFPGSNAFHSALRAPGANLFTDTTAQYRTKNLIIDFAAGRDVGLGMFGQYGSSIVEGGIRFAQFSSGSSVGINANTEFHWTYQIFSFPFEYIRFPHSHWHAYTASEQEQRSFHGVGPSISWKVSDVFAGNPDESELELDWGLNAAVLFGRQRAKMHHETAGRNFKQGNLVSNITFPPLSGDRSHSVVVPNAGGFASLSLKFPNAKLSLGYRADFFFGAMDGGIDTRKSENRGFFGPFASVSIGVGGSSD